MTIAYRYATADTFTKMLQSQELWFTDLRHMNDWDEYSAGFRIANETMKKEFPEYADILGEIAPERMSDEFMMLICSFSSHGDSLSMWRGYGDNGKGAAIGYSTQDIENHHLFNRFLEKKNPIQGKVKFSPVIYSKEIYLESLRSHISRALHINEELNSDDTASILEVRKKILGVALTLLCTLYKNDFFKDEREIRGFIEISKHIDPYIIGINDNGFGNAKFHKIHSNFQGVPSIKEVVLGPSCEMTDEFVKATLIACGLPDVVIRHSMGTYRLPK